MNLLVTIDKCSVFNTSYGFYSFLSQNASSLFTLFLMVGFFETSLVHVLLLQAFPLSLMTFLLKNVGKMTAITHKFKQTVNKQAREKPSFRGNS